MSNKPKPEVGMRVVHSRAGSNRCGWTGVVKQVDRNGRFHVIWELGVHQSYDPSAFGKRWDDEDPSVKYVNPIHNQETKPMKYIVQGAAGNGVSRFETRAEAVDYAIQCAARSKSGQRYILFTATDEYQREDPPVSHRFITSENDRDSGPTD